MRNYLAKRGTDAYRTKREEVEAIARAVGEAERFFVLSQTDNLWKNFQAIKFVPAVGLRGYAQKDPLIEYKLGVTTCSWR